jgi:hypothetical protein
MDRRRCAGTLDEPTAEIDRRRLPRDAAANVLVTASVCSGRSRSRFDRSSISVVLFVKVVNFEQTSPTGVPKISATTPAGVE